MSALQTLKTIVPGVDADAAATRTFECRDCGNVIESAKDTERVRCFECMSQDVEPR